MHYRYWKGAHRERILAAWLLAMNVLHAPPILAGESQASDEPGSVVQQLEGIRTELRSISEQLSMLQKHEQVSVLMTRIQLKQQRLSSIESDLRTARGEQNGILHEIEDLENVERTWTSDLEARDFDQPQDEDTRRQLELLRQQKKTFESRVESLRQRILELENDLARAREEILILEETVDEQLGLR